VGVVWGPGAAVGSAQTVGDALFPLGGLAWPAYTVAMRRARLDGLHATAIAAGGSLAIYCPASAILAGTGVFKAPPFEIALRAVVQGVPTAIVALLLYRRLVSLLWE
jgi:hypothetical protein